jgi:RimJ/RimL family protein N-acetyltransferase
MGSEKQVLLKNSQTVTLRYPNSNDADALTTYINKLSAEDTFLLVSGEVITREEEQNYLNNLLQEITNKNRIQILAFYKNQLVGNVEVNRLVRRRKRSLHVGEIAISIAKDFRNLGLGKILLQEIIKQSKNIGLKQVYLTTFSNNETACTLYKKLGFIQVGEIPDHILYRDKYIGMIFMYLPLK